MEGFAALLAVRFVNAASLVSLVPLTQWLVTTQVPRGGRGRAFSVVAMCGTLGVIVVSHFSTAISGELVLGVPGWRVGLYLIGAACMLLGGVLLVVAALSSARRVRAAKWEDAEAVATAQGPAGAKSCEAPLHSGRPRGVLLVKQSFLENWSIHTFRVVCLGGCFGAFAFRVLQFSTLWLQYCGLSDAQAGLVSALWHTGDAVGAVCGGVLGDVLARWDPQHGRQFLAQGCYALALPVLVAIFNLAPQDSESAKLFAAGTFLLGMSLSAGAPGVYKPLLSEVCSPTQVASIMAWHGALNKTFSILFLPGLVSAASRYGGYQASSLSVAEMSRAEQAQNARGLAFTITSLCSVCLLGLLATSTKMHWSFKWDLSRAEAQV